MLRRTRANQVEPVYSGFIQQFPDPDSLASARTQDVLDALYPLGLHWRAPTFQILARELVQRWAGKVPEDRESLLSLPGVGEYVADAVRCFVFHDHAALIDTNTIRLAGRFLGFEHSGDVRRRRYVRSHIENLIGAEDCRSINLAMLDFAALVCRARNPQCAICPLAEKCKWYQSRQCK
jgi:A/G-specific adenine glycosylase